MRKFRIEVFADGRPLRVEPDVVDGSNHGVAAGRAYRAAKASIRRGTKQVTVRVTALAGVRSGDLETSS